MSEFVDKSQENATFKDDEARNIIKLWAENLELANSVEGGSNGVSKSMMLEKLNEISSQKLSEEQLSAIEELNGMSLKTGIETDRIKELSRLF